MFRHRDAPKNRNVAMQSARLKISIDRASLIYYSSLQCRSSYASKLMQHHFGGKQKPHLIAIRSFSNRQCRGLLCDLDGVVWESGQLIPGALETFEWLRKKKIPFKFVSNTTTKRRAELADKLTKCGIRCCDDDVINPAALAVQWLQAHNAGPVALFVSPNIVPEFSAVQVLPAVAEQGAAAVVIGDMGAAWTFTELNRAFRLLMGLPAPTLIALGKSRYFKSSDALQLDVGPFVAALEYAAGCTALVLGKPDESVFKLAARSLGVEDVQQVVMVGDDIVGDVQGAQRAGLRGVLVQTGKFRAADLEAGCLPDAVLASLADLPQWWAQGHDC